MLFITKLHVLAVVNSQGFGDGSMSTVDIFTSYKDLIEEAYYRYKNIYLALKENNLEELNNNDNEFYSIESFEKELTKEGYVTIQLNDYHFSFEAYQRNVELEKK